MNNILDIDYSSFIRELFTRLPYDVNGICEVFLHNPEKETETYTFKARLTGFDSADGYGLFVKPLDDNDFFKVCDEINDGIDICQFTPYLRPMSDMTMRELKDLYARFGEKSNKSWAEFQDLKFDEIVIGFNDSWQLLDWLNRHHFDYNGWLSKANAYLMPKEMYKFI